MTFSWRSYIDALSAMFNECIARHGKVPHWVSQDPDQRSCVDVGASLEGLWRVDLSYLPAADSEKEAEDVGLLLLLKLFDVFEGSHLESFCQPIRASSDHFERQLHSGSRSQ